MPPELHGHTVVLTRAQHQLGEARRLFEAAGAQVLDLPPKQRALHPVDLTEREALGFDHRVDLVVEDYRHRVRLGQVRSDAEPLAVLTSLRRIASEFKLPALEALLSRLRSDGQAVVVFSGFVDPLLLLHQRVGGELLTGRQRPQERQRAVDRFQQQDCDLLLATYGTGGLGFTLHRARHVVLLERPWTPGDLEQAEDRCHRLGMGDGLTCHWLQLGPADQLVDGLVASKAERIDVLLGPRRIALERQSLPAMVRSCLQAA